jgi:hypothetical protein
LRYMTRANTEDHSRVLRFVGPTLRGIFEFEIACN